MPLQAVKIGHDSKQVKKVKNSKNFTKTKPAIVSNS